MAVIGTAQPYTHTAFNNIVTMGIYDGIFIKNVQTAGEALIYGQLELANIYPQNPNNNVYYISNISCSVVFYQNSCVLFFYFFND